MTAYTMRFIWLMLLTVLTAACERSVPPSTVPTATQPEFVGSDSCRTCHAAQYNDWQRSHHQLAMQKLSATTALGQFHGQTLAHHGINSRFTEAMQIDTEGKALPLTYTFGLYPLQQYLTPQTGGRLQALPQAWDSRPASAGGQRWFHLYDDQKIDGDNNPLHWSSASHNANHMCLECHTTGFVKNVSTDGKQFDSQWQELGVGCESCHGPASQHVHWAQTANPLPNLGFNQPLARAYAFTRQSGAMTKPVLAHGSEANTAHPPQTEQCATCHSRRSRISDGAAIKSLYDNFMPALLDPSLYHIDGQIKDEVFEYGSFMQSKMAHAGVTCSNCHNPHSAQLKIEGNGLCLQCHDDRHNQPQHTLHPVNSPGSFCVDCHMPATTYMQVDPRRDHSLRIPRPDLSDTLGTPNACQQCHQQSNQQLSNWMRQHYGSDWQTPHYGKIFWRAERGYRDAIAPLTALLSDANTAPMVKAQALVWLGQLQVPPAAIRQALGSAQPLKQLAALSLGEQQLMSHQSELLQLLKAPELAVRLEAFRLISSYPALQGHSNYPAARAEYIASQQQNADRAAAHTNLARLAANENRPDDALLELQQALALEPYFVPATINLTDLLRAMQRDHEATSYYQQALILAPDSAELQHAYGLWLVRQNQLTAALDALQQAAQLSTRPYYRFVYALALQQAQQTEASWQQLWQASQSEFYDPLVMQAAAEMAVQQQRKTQLTQLLKRWQQFDPKHPLLIQLQASLAQP